MKKRDKTLQDSEEALTEAWEAVKESIRQLKHDHKRNKVFNAIRTSSTNTNISNTSPITKAQNERIANVASQMTDVETQNAYKKFVENNFGDMKKNSQLIRTLNRIDDPNKFFTDTKNFDVSLGGRQGKTVIVTDAHGNAMRCDPNQSSVFLNIILKV